MPTSRTATLRLDNKTAAAPAVQKMNVSTSVRPSMASAPAIVLLFVGHCQIASPIVVANVAIESVGTHCVRVDSRLNKPTASTKTAPTAKEINGDIAAQS